MSSQDPSAVRSEMLDRWERGAEGWARRADDIRDFGRPVSDWMIDELNLEPGQRVLELAAGPGDTGFLAAKRISPGGTLISSDASEAMLDIARERARELGVDNVEFVHLQLEWIDLDTASVDAALCRWALMLLVDPAAAAQEIRRVLRPGGRFATAVWGAPEDNLWATIPTRALIELGHAQPPDRDAPGMFRLGDSGRLSQLLESAGFVEFRLDTLDIGRARPSLDAYLAEQLDLSLGFRETRQRLDDQQWNEVLGRVAELAEPFTGSDGSVTFPARCLLASAST